MAATYAPKRMTFGQATTALNAIGLKIVMGEAMPVGSAEQHERVVFVTPGPGTWLDPGSEVTVRLGNFAG